MIAPQDRRLTRLVVASHNQGKVREINELLAPLGVEASSAVEFGLAEPEETEWTFAGNALLKARAAHQATGLAVLADDSGLEVAGLGGAPGIFSARWAGGGRDFGLAMQRVEAALGDARATDRSARFVSVLALIWPDGAEEIFEGEARGAVVFPPRGDRGFGYDPIFLPDGESRTFGEMAPEEKKRLNHRAKAFAKLVARLG